MSRTAPPQGDAAGAAPDDDAAGPTTEDARRAYLLAVADDELVTGHRTQFWTGVAPSLEEDLAFATISQDEINHADLWYQVLLGGGTGEDVERAAVDELGFGRQPGDYRHAVLCERPPGDFAATVARQLLYDHFDSVRLAGLTGSTDEAIAAVARRLLHEERYHLLHADEWVERLARAGGEPARRLHAGLAGCWPDALWLFEPVPGEAVLTAASAVPPSTDLLGPWMEAVLPRLEHAGMADVVESVERAGTGWRLPAGYHADPGGRHGVHTQAWPPVWDEMTGLYRAHPGARW